MGRSPPGCPTDSPDSWPGPRLLPSARAVAVRAVPKDRDHVALSLASRRNHISDHVIGDGASPGSLAEDMVVVVVVIERGGGKASDPADNEADDEPDEKSVHRRARRDAWSMTSNWFA